MTCTGLTSTINILHIRPRENTADVSVLTFSEYIHIHLVLLHAHESESWGYGGVCERGQLLFLLFVPLYLTLL